MWPAKPNIWYFLVVNWNAIANDRKARPASPRSSALAKLIGDIATGQVEDINEDGKNASAANLGRLGSAARARALSPEKRAEIAKKEAASRWHKE